MISQPLRDFIVNPEDFHFTLISQCIELRIALS